jgi:predicted PurR-regulated permease PerM
MEPARPPVRNPFRESVRVLGIYIKAQVIITAVVTVLYAIGFGLAHMPWFALVALLAGLCNVIPRIGSLIGLALIALVAFFLDMTLMQSLAVFAVWVVVQGFEGFYLTPKLLGKPLGLRPLLVFFAMLAGSSLFGPIGFLLAVPALAVANVFWRYFQERNTPR